MYGKQDFLKNIVLKKLVIMTAEDVAKEYNLNLFAVECFEETVRTGMPFGKMLTEYEVLELYMEGFSFREIGYLKGITKEGVRYIFDRLPIEKDEVKKEHRERRKELWRKVRHERILEEVEKVGVEGAAEVLGYSVRYLNILLRDMKRR